ncbi:MAG: amidophosphoribosyltransferase [Thermoproteota archaeon]
MCGVAAWLGSNAYSNVYKLLLEQQHRGHDAAGIAFLADDGIRVVGGGGYVWQAVPSPQEVWAGNVRMAIGHVRYSTSGGYTEHYQPVVSMRGLVAVAFNGTIYNFVEVAQEVLGSRGYLWDARVLADVIEHFYLETGSLADAVRQASQVVRGAYSIVAISVKREFVAARDPHGVRPLAYSTLPDGSLAVASETGALQSMNLEWKELPAARYIYCREGGEEVECYGGGLPIAAQPRPCAFEYIYFLRPDSTFEGVVAHEARKRMGALLARIDDEDVDVAVPVPDSGRSAAIGYAMAKGVPLDEALYRNRFVGRAFITAPSLRPRRLRSKFSAIPSSLSRARVAVVDDSIVRGETSRLVVRLVRRAGAKKVHFRSASPPILFPCFYGVDIPSRSELVASRLGVDGVAEFIGADSLLYNTIENLVKAIGRPVCLGCFNMSYPHKIDVELLEKRFSSGRR